LLLYSDQSVRRRTGPLRPDHGPFSGWYDAAGWFRKRCQRSLGARFAAALQNLSSNPSPRETQRRRESVGRVSHVRDAPPSVHPETSGGQRTARPTRYQVLAKRNHPRKCESAVMCLHDCAATAQLQRRAPRRGRSTKLRPTWKSALQCFN